LLSTLDSFWLVLTTESLMVILSKLNIFCSGLFSVLYRCSLFLFYVNEFTSIFLISNLFVSFLFLKYLSKLFFMLFSYFLSITFDFYNLEPPNDTFYFDSVLNNFFLLPSLIIPDGLDFYYSILFPFVLNFIFGLGEFWVHGCKG